MFSATAEYYDKIYAFKDYRTEVETLVRAPRKTWGGQEVHCWT